MSTLLSLFKASKKLYEDFENSRPLTYVPIVNSLVNSYKAFMLDDKQVPAPKEDSVIEELIHKLALDPAVEKSNRLKNLVKILQACIAKTDVATLRTNLAALREENKTLFGTQTFHVDYAQALDDFIAQKLLLEQHQETLAALRAEIARKDAAITTSLQVNTAERERLQAEKAQVDSTLIDVSAKLDEETQHNNMLIAQSEHQDTIISDFKRGFKIEVDKLETELTRRFNLLKALTERNDQYALTITGLRQELETHKETIEKLEGKQSDLDNELNTARYNLSETTERLELTGKAHLETDSQLAKAEQIISGLDKKIVDLRAMNQEQVDKIKVLEATIKMHLGVNAELQTMHAQALQQADTQFRASAKELETRFQKIEAMSKVNSQQSETRLRETEAKVREAHNRSAEIQKLLDRAKVEKATLKTRFDEMVSEHQKTIDALTQQVKEITAAKSQADAKSKVNATQASSDIKGLTKERADLEKEKKQLEIELATSKSELDKAKIAAAAATKKAKEMAQALAYLETKLADSEALRIEIEEDNAAMKESFDAAVSANVLSAFSSDTATPATTAARNDSKASGAVTGTPQTMYSARKAADRKQQSKQPDVAPQLGKRLSH